MININELSGMGMIDKDSSEMEAIVMADLDDKDDMPRIEIVGCTPDWKGNMMETLDM